MYTPRMLNIADRSRPVWHHLVSAILLAAFAFAVPIMWPTAAQAACVEDGWIFPYRPFGNTAFGDMAVIYHYPNTNSCNVEAHTVFVRLANDYSSYVEVGVKQYSNGEWYAFWAQRKPGSCPDECFSDVYHLVGA